MDKKFVVGNSVKPVLLSAAEMIVTNIHENTINGKSTYICTCVWFFGPDLNSEEFPQDSLRRCKRNVYVMDEKPVLGDSVKLIARGPEMAVINIQEGIIDGKSTYIYECQWFFGPKFYSGKFPEDSLKLFRKRRKSN